VLGTANRVVTLHARVDNEGKIIKDAIFLSKPNAQKEQDDSKVEILAGAERKQFGRTAGAESDALDLSSSSYVSGKHFAVALSNEGKLTIEDTGSTNNTRIVESTPTAEAEPVADITVPRSEIMKELENHQVPAEVEKIGDLAVEKIAEVVEVPVAPESEVVTAVEAVEVVPPAPTMAEIFTNGSTLEQALQSPDTAPGTRRTLQEIVRAKQDAEQAMVVEQAWTEDIAPRLRGFKDALPAAKQQVDQLADVMTTGADALSRLMYAIDDGNMEEITDAVRRGNFRDMLDTMTLASRNINAENVMQQVGTSLEMQASDSNDVIKRVLNPDRELSPEALDGLAEQVGAMLAAGADEATIKRELSKDVPEDVATTWRRKKSAIEEVTSYARAGAREAGDIPAGMIGITNDIELFIEEMRGGRYSGEDAAHLSGRINQFNKHYLDPAQRMLTQTSDLAQDIR
jgi:hypothetical protein